MTRLVMTTALLSIGALALSSGARADDQDTIDYRRHVMSSMGEQADAIGMILQHRAPVDNFAVHVQTLAVIAATAKKAFEPKVAGGDAKPEVWAQWANFSKRLDDLVASTADLAKVAKDGGITAAGPKVESALTCKSCHDSYRVPKK
jgi:cytochrome c556